MPIYGFSGMGFRPANIALFVMCRFSFYNVLRDWWEHGKLDVSHMSKSNFSLPALAAMGGCEPICQNLIKRAQDAKWPRDDFLGKALVEPARYGETEAVKTLLSMGAGVDTQAEDVDKESLNALTNAAIHGRLNTVELLVQAGADVNMMLNNYYGTALAAAAYHGYIGVVKCLIDAGADIHMQLQYGRYGSALAAASAAVFDDNVRVVKFLVEAGADVDLQLQHGEFGSALAAAVAGGST
ncbi:ankyrin repeat-containing domain protein [Xylaria sp. FL0064]|nr:ankyrin repeat-containing domain protein [Xylaria sp. FL0064]